MLMLPRAYNTVAGSSTTMQTMRKIDFVQCLADHETMDSTTQTNEMEEANRTELDLDTEPLVIGGLDFGTSDYHEAYRDGNFGIKRGRINFIRARKWSISHLIVAVLIEIVSIIVVCLLQFKMHDGISEYTRDVFPGLAISCGLIALATSSCSLYLVKYITTMKRPLFVLLLVMILAFLECLLAVPTFITTIVAVSVLYNQNNTGLLLAVCEILPALLLVDIFAAMAWLFQWWRCRCKLCQGFNSLCIFEREQTPAVSRVPRTLPSSGAQADQHTGTVKECMEICWAAYRPDWRIII